MKPLTAGYPPNNGSVRMAPMKWNESTFNSKRILIIVYVLLAVSFIFNILQFFVFNYMSSVSKESRMRAIYQCETHRDAMSVVAKKYISRDDVKFMKSLRIKVDEDSNGQYIRSTLGNSTTCVKTYQIEKYGDVGGIVLLDPCKTEEFGAK